MKLPTLSNILSGFASADKLNTNFQRITTGFNNTLSLDGSVPNSMLANLDLNSHRIVNVTDPVDIQDVVTLAYLNSHGAQSSEGASAYEIAVLNGFVGSESAWLASLHGTTGTAGTNGTNGTNGAAATITVGSVTTGSAGSSVVVTNSGSTSAAVFDFTIPRGATGASGAGSGDMVGANNLSEVTSAATARSNLGLVIGTNVQAYDAELAAIAGLTSASDKLPFFTGSGTASVTTFTSYGRTVVSSTDAAALRTTLALGTAAVQNVGAFCQVSNNLSDVTASTARTNLGLGTLAVLDNVSTKIAGGTGISLSTTGNVTTITNTGSGSSGGSGGSASTFIGEAGSYAASTSVTINKPGSLLTGDTAFIFVRDGTISGGSGGWTKIIDMLGSGNLAVWTKTLTATDISATLTLTGANPTVAHFMAYRGATTTAVKIASVVAGGSGLAITGISPAVSATSANGRFVTFCRSLGSTSATDIVEPYGFQKYLSQSDSVNIGRYSTADILVSNYLPSPIVWKTQVTGSLVFSMLELY